MMPEERRGMGGSGMAEGWDKIKGYLLDNPTLALTLLYLYVTAVGMLYSAVLYGRFGINIFDYSEIADFLLAAFKSPIALVAAGIQVALLYMMTYIVMWWRTPERERDYEARAISPLEPVKSMLMARPPMLMARTRVLAVIFLAVIFLAGTCLFAIVRASSIKNGNKPTVEVRYRSFSGSAGQVTVPGLEFIGATQRAAFFYDVDDKRTIVIPQSQLVSIEVPEQD
jgi:hypothetical protein